MISSKEKSKQIIKKHFPFLVFLFRKAKYPYWILRKIYKENEKIIVYKIFGEKTDRNQWSIGNKKLMETYRQMMLWSWEETKSNSPQYFERMQYAVLKCRGRVLEIGCGIGTMTKFISMSKKVTEIVAIDAFPEAIEELKTYNLPKLTALQIPLEEIKFDNTRKFDTVILCEIIEHIFPDQEMKMLHALKPYINAKTIYIVSTPIGWLEDPHHVRGFSKRNLKRHLKRLYGEPIDIDYSAEYSQSAFGYFNKATLDTN